MDQFSISDGNQVYYAVRIEQAGWSVYNEIGNPLFQNLPEFHFFALLDQHVIIYATLPNQSESAVYCLDGTLVGESIRIRDENWRFYLGIRLNTKWYIIDYSGNPDSVLSGKGEFFFEDTDSGTCTRYFARRLEDEKLVVIDKNGKQVSKYAFEDIGGSIPPYIFVVRDKPVFKGKQGDRWFVVAPDGNLLGIGDGGFLGVYDFLLIRDTFYFRVLRSIETKERRWWLGPKIRRERWFVMNERGEVIGLEEGFDSVWPFTSCNEGLYFAARVEDRMYAYNEDGVVIGEPRGYARIDDIVPVSGGVNIVYSGTR